MENLINQLQDDINTVKSIFKKHEHDINELEYENCKFSNCMDKNTLLSKYDEFHANSPKDEIKENTFESDMKYILNNFNLKKIGLTEIYCKKNSCQILFNFDDDKISLKNVMCKQTIVNFITQDPTSNKIFSELLKYGDVEIILNKYYPNYKYHLSVLDNIKNNYALFNISEMDNITFNRNSLVLCNIISGKNYFNSDDAENYLCYNGSEFFVQPKNNHRQIIPEKNSLYHFSHVEELMDTFSRYHNLNYGYYENGKYYNNIYFLFSNYSLNQMFKKKYHREHNNIDNFENIVSCSLIKGQFKNFYEIYPYFKITMTVHYDKHMDPNNCHLNIDFDRKIINGNEEHTNYQISLKGSFSYLTTQIIQILQLFQ